MDMDNYFWYETLNAYASYYSIMQLQLKIASVIISMILIAKLNLPSKI